MGKGDKKTRRGKIYRGTFGKRRLKKRKAILTVTSKQAENKDVVKPPEALVEKEKSELPQDEKKVAVETKSEKKKTSKKRTPKKKSDQEK